jgi:hypothetical protein
MTKTLAFANAFISLSSLKPINKGMPSATACSGENIAKPLLLPTEAAA